jgi:diadenosine tetraphosphate (Ap4A) HIT family hydrolase
VNAGNFTGLDAMDSPFRFQLELARQGKHPMHIADLKRTVVFLSDNQGFPGWCVLIYKTPVLHLSDLSLDEQMGLFREVALVAAAIRARFSPVRINYECLCNQVHHLHWHVIPRYGSDPDPTKPVWGFPEATLRGSATPESIQQSIISLRAALGK